MLSNRPKTWVDQALNDPMGTFAAPAEVLRDQRLDEAGMRAVLLSWERQARSFDELRDESALLKDLECAFAELDRIESIARLN